MNLAFNRCPKFVKGGRVLHIELSCDQFHDGIEGLGTAKVVWWCDETKQLKTAGFARLGIILYPPKALRQWLNCNRVVAINKPNRHVGEDPLGLEARREA